MKFPIDIPFVEHLGFELQSFGGGASEICVTLKPELLNSWHVAHGGLSMTLLDVAMAHCIREPSDFNAPGMVTIEMKTTFMRPGLGRLTVKGRLLHKSSTMGFTEGTITDETGKIVAHATGTFKFLTTLAKN